MQRYSNKSFKWYEQDREANDLSILKDQQNILTPEWNKRKPVEIQMYSTTLENHTNTQQYLIDRIIQRLDQIEHQLPTNFSYNSYLYSSPSHKNVICSRIPQFTNKNSASFTIPSKKTSHSVLEKVKPKPNHLSNTTNTNHDESIEHILKNISKTNNCDSDSIDFLLQKLQKKSSSNLIPHEVEQSDNDSKKSIKILNVPKVPPLPPSLIKNQNFLDNVQSDQSEPSVHVSPCLLSVPPPPPPPLLSSTLGIDIKTTSGDESDNMKMPNNFLSELVKKKKKLKKTEIDSVPSEDVKDSDEFIKELKERINNYQEDFDRGKKIEHIIKQNLDKNEKLPNENLLNKDEKNIKKDDNIVVNSSKVDQQTQTDILSKKNSLSSVSFIKSTKSTKSSSSSMDKQNSGFKVVSIDNQKVKDFEDRKKSDSTISYGNTSSESSSSEQELNQFITKSKLMDKSIELDDSQYVDNFVTPMSTINSSRTHSQQSIKTSTDNDTIKLVNEDFTLNIFTRSFEQNYESNLPLVYKCRPLERNARLKNVLIKLYFDLEKYNSQTNNEELDILVKNPNDSQEHVGNSSLASFRRTESYSENLNQSSSDKTIASREAFFESLRQLVEESQDETDTEYQRSFQNLNDFYNSLLRKFHNKFQPKNDNFDVVSSAISEVEADSMDNQLSDSSVVHSDINEFSDLYKIEQNKLKNQRKSSLIDVIDEASEESSSDTVFRPSKKFDNESFEKMNAFGGIDERSISRNSKGLRSRTDDQMKMSTDSDEAFTRPYERKTPTKYFKKRQDSDLYRIYDEEEKKFRTNSSLDVKNGIWDKADSLVSDMGRAKSVPAEKMKKEERERPKSVAFLDDRNKSESGDDISNLVNIWSQAKRACENKSDERGLADIWKEINRKESAKELKRLEELKKNTERSNLFIIWNEASSVSKQRSKMMAYEQVSKEQRAYELKKIDQQDLDEIADDTINEKLSLKNTPLPAIPSKKSSSSSISSTKSLIPVSATGQKIPTPPPLPNIGNSSIVGEKKETAKPESLLGEKNASSSDNKESKTKKSLIPVLINKFKKSDSTESEEYIDLRLTPPTPPSPLPVSEPKYSTIENLIKKFEAKDNPVTVSTSNSDTSNKVPLRAGGLIANKEVHARKKNELDESRKSFSQQANSLLENVKKSHSFKISSLHDDKISSLNEDIDSETDQESKASNKRKSSLEYSILNDRENTSNSSASGVVLSDETSDSDYDIEKYFILKNDQEIPKLPPKLSPEQLDKAKNAMTKSESDSSSNDYAIPRNISLFNLEKKESNNQSVPSFISQESEKTRNSSLLDKILLTQSNSNQEDKFFKDLAKKEISANAENAGNENTKNISESDSLQSAYVSEEENLESSANQGPSAETLEIIRRLREIPSQSASPKMYGLQKIDSEMTRETKLSGGKQRKPNEESFDKNLKRTKSSNSVNLGIRNSFFNKLFGRDKKVAKSSSSSGPSFKKKKNLFKN